MTIITITTVGFGEVKPLSLDGRIFTLFFIVLGLSTAAVLAGQIAKSFLEKNFIAIIEENKMRKKISRIRDHIIICGFGDIGSSISAELYAAGIPFVVIENNERIAEFAMMKNYLVVKGKATYDDTLIEAGIKRARGIVVCLGDDSLNMYVTLAARELNPKLLTIVRGYKADGEKRMLRAGANSVIYPLRIGGQQMAQLILSEYSKKLKENQLEVSTIPIMGYSLKLYKHMRKEISVSEILETPNVLKVVKIKRSDGTEVHNPEPDFKVQKEDRVLVLVEEKYTDLFEEENNGDKEEFLQKV
ncbi:MAG: hypothetical protein DRP54_01475 [Spirochaetes bacterium]|nr:MAG: hypothetical protein DRP54_01475 [Spirochaetota bacterium]